MRIKDLRDIKDLGELRELSANDVVDVLDELRAIATKRGTELLGQGRQQARRAIGAPGEGAVTWAFLIGIALGAAAAAIATMLMTPMAGSDARRRLSAEADRVRERVATVRPDGNGRSAYEREGVTPSGASRTGAPTPEIGTTGGGVSSPTA